MTTPTHGPIMQAFVRRLRAITGLEALLKGGIHEGFAPEDVPYPFLVWNLVFGPYEYEWGSLTLIAGFDAFIFSRNSEEAKGLDAVVAAGLSDQPFPVDGQTTLLCRRTATVPMTPDLDNQQKKVYSSGGSYEVWTDAPISPRVFSVGAADVTVTSDSA